MKETGRKPWREEVKQKAVGLKAKLRKSFTEEEVQGMLCLLPGSVRSRLGLVVGLMVRGVTVDFGKSTFGGRLRVQACPE